MRRSLTVVLGCVLAVVLAGCGAVAHMTITPSSPGFTKDVTTGEALFKTSCSACHTLANAGAVGTIGPDLDAAFGPDRCQGFAQSTIQDVVRGQIAYADDNPEADWPPVPMKINGTIVQPANVQGMPPNIVTGQKAKDVASYVAEVAGMTQAETGGKAPYWSCTTGAEVTSSSS
jgi:cytochrome c5